ncbi:hypothetical protein [Streptomyces sp. 6N106]
MTDDAQRHAADGMDHVVALLMRQHGEIRNFFDEVERSPRRTSWPVRWRP